MLYPNVLQHTIYHPPIFDNGAESTFMAPAKVKTFEVEIIYLTQRNKSKRKRLSIPILPLKSLKFHFITAKRFYFGIAKQILIKQT